MALTEKKQRISEEEAYRTKIREEHRNQTSSRRSQRGCSGCFIVIIIIVALPILLAISLLAINPAKQFEDAEKAVKEQQEIETKYGKFKDFTRKEYAYDISFEAGDDKYVASYQPFLKNDDRILIQAILAVFIETYGENNLIDPAPLLEQRNGINLIKFRGET